MGVASFSGMVAFHSFHDTPHLKSMKRIESMKRMKSMKRMRRGCQLPEKIAAPSGIDSAFF